MVQGVNRCGELESEVRFPRTTMVARQPILPDFTENGFPGGFRHRELESGVRLPRTRMVARQPIHRDFIEKGFPGVFRDGELESAVNLTGMRGVDRQLFEIEFTGKKVFWGISMEKTWIRAQLIERVMVDDPASIRSWNKDRREISRESKRSGDLFWFLTFFLSLVVGTDLTMRFH